MMKTKKETRSSLSRRTVLQGAGVALALPFLESLAPRRASSQIATPPKRFIAMNFPNGATTEFWKPQAIGSGSAWQLSPVLAPLLPVKGAVSVLNNVGNYGPFGGHVEPSHANNYAAFLTCTKPHGPMDGTVGISVDQVIANGIGGATKIPSLQVGLSTLDSYAATDCRGRGSRSVSCGRFGSAARQDGRPAGRSSTSSSPRVPTLERCCRAQIPWLRRDGTRTRVSSTTS